jgi:flagellar hook-length control protein FliK
VKAKNTVGQNKPNAALASPKASAKNAAPLAATGEPVAAARADPFDAAMLGQSAHAATAQTQQATLERGAERAAPAAQVGREIVRRFQGESTRFELRLDPPELGRIEVRLDVSRDNRVTAIISADNPQALTDLVRHARELEQSLQAAGLELSENGLSFDLRQQSDTSRHAEREAGNGGGGTIDSPIPEAVVTARPLGFERWRGLRVDVMA